MPDWFLAISRVKRKTNTRIPVAFCRATFSERVNYYAAETDRPLPKERRIIYFYTIRHLHFKRASIYEINDNLSAKHERIRKRNAKRVKAYGEGG